MEAGGPRPGCLTRRWDGSLGLCARSRPPCTSQTFLGGDTAPLGCGAPPQRDIPAWGQAGEWQIMEHCPSPDSTGTPRSCALRASDLQCRTTAASEGEPCPRDHQHLSSPSLTPSPAPQGGDTPNLPPLQAMFCPSAAPQLHLKGNRVQAGTGTSPPPH